MKIKWLGLIVILAGFMLAGNFVLAQDEEAIGISSSIIEKSVAAGGTTSDKVSISNEGENTVQYEMVVKGFQPTGNMGSIEFVGITEEGLLGWVEFSENEFTVEPNETREITYVVNVPEEAVSGGHYAVISAMPITENIVAGKNEKLLALLMLNVTGDLKYKGGITEFKTLFDSYKPSEAIDFIVGFKNEGNVHAKPSGYIEIFKGNTKVDELVVNPDGYFVFPGAIRDFHTTWKQGTNFGKYTAYVNLTFGGTEEVSADPISFWVVNWTTIIIVLVVVVVAILLIILLTRKKKKDKKSGK